MKGPSVPAECYLSKLRWGWSGGSLEPTEHTQRPPPLQLQAQSQGRARSEEDLLHIKGEISPEP